MIRILQASDCPLLLIGIRTVLDTQEKLKLVGEATNSDEAKQLSQELNPDLLLLDLDMISALPTKKVNEYREQYSEMKVLVLSANEVYVQELIAAGVTGYVLKEEAVEVIVRAISSVAGGDIWFSRAIIEKLVQGRESDPVPIENTLLTKREQQILSMIAEGRSNAHIAAKLCLAKQTVRNYASRIYIKLSVSSRAEAIVWAREHGIVGTEFI